MLSQIRQILIIILVAIGVFFISRATVQSFVVLGSSMNPNLENGQRIMVDKAIYRIRDPHRGEVIVFQPPNGKAVDFIKRVIGLPGDTVEIQDGLVFINGYALNEPYIKAHPSYTMAEEEIPAGEYFVLGDNRNNSNDSHSWGTVPQENIVGKAWLSFWPPGTIKSYNYNNLPET